MRLLPFVAAVRVDEPSGLFGTDDDHALAQFQFFVVVDRATVFVEDDSWYLLVHTRCKHLGDDQRCGIYETRPQICRDYTTESCEYDDEWVYDQYLETPEQVEEFAEATLGPRKGRGFRSVKPK